MAINTKKFLPISKTSSAIVKYSGSNIAVKNNNIKSGSLIKSKKIAVQKFLPSQDSADEKYGAIIKSLESVNSLLRINLENDKKSSEKERIITEKEESEKKEKKLETREKPKGVNLPTLSLPKFDFLESVKRYFLFTFLGWLFTNTQQFIPQLLKILDIVKPVVSAAEFIFKGLLEGFVNFIDFGYKAYDTIRASVKNLGGEGAQKTFDDLSKNLNTLITTTILVAGAVATLGEKTKEPKEPTRPQGPQPRGGPRRSPITRRPVPTTSGGRTAGSRFDVRNPLRERPKVTTSGGRTVSPSGRGLPIKGTPFIGPLLDFGIRTLIYRDPPGRAAAGAIGAGIGQAIGTFIGGIGATALGLGTMGLGAVIAPLIVGAGAVIGGLVGDWIGISLYDAVVSMLDRKKIEKKAVGGKVSPKTKVNQGKSRRSIKVSRRKPIIVKPSMSQPGKDIGGPERIKILYPDTGSRFITQKEYENWKRVTGSSVSYTQYLVDQRQSQGKRPNPYKALTGAAEILKEIPLVGGIMGAGVDVALGQKPDKRTYKSLSSAIGYMVESLASHKTNMSIMSLFSELRGFAEGGTVPGRELKSNYSDMNVSDMIAKVLEPTIMQKVNEAIQSIEKELKLKGEDATTPTDYGPIEYGPLPLTMSNKQAFATIYELAKKNGAAMPELVAGMAMNESGYLKSTLATQYNNPFGQTGTGTKGSTKIPGNDRTFAVYNSLEDAVKDHIRNWNNDSKHGKGAGTYDSAVQGLRAILPIYDPGGNHSQYIKNVSSILSTMGFDPQKKNPKVDLSSQRLIQQRKPTAAGIIPGNYNIPTSGYKPKSPGLFNAIQYITGDSTQVGNYDAAGHGGSKYHEHIAFKTEGDKEKAKAALRRAGFEIGSEYRPGDSGYHGANLAIDVPLYKPSGGVQKGYSDDTKGEQQFSAEVRRVLGLQGGGLVAPKKISRSLPNSFASYENYGQGTIIAILPIETEVIVQVPSGSGGGMMFPSSTLNRKNTFNVHSLSRG